MRLLHRKFILTDMPTWLMLVLVAVGLPRTILADLDIVAPESGLLYYVLALVPFALWLAVAVFRKSRRPFMDFLVLGVLYGLSLVVIHLLSEEYSAGATSTILIAMTIGLGTGLVVALIAVGASRVTRPATTSHRTGR